MPAAERRARHAVSLRAGLTGVYALAMAGVLTALGAFIYLRLAADLMQAVDLSLQSRADALTTALADDPGTPLGGGHRFVDPDEAFAQVLDPSGRILDSTLGAAGTPLLTERQAGSLTRPSYIVRERPDGQDPDRLLAVPMRLGGRAELVVVGETLGDRSDALRRLLAIYAITGPAGLAAASVVGWLLAGAALRPVERIRRRAAELSDTDPGGRLPVPTTGDELSRLATTLNALLARLHATVDREHRFVDDASHELRTPLAVLKAELDLALTRPRGVEELQATVRAASVETDRLVQLAEDLLVLARVRGGGLPLRLAPADLAELIELAADPLRTRVAEDGRRIEIRAEHHAVRLDQSRVRGAIQNLVDNALRHGRGTVTVTAAAESGAVQIEVHDQGPGFTEPTLATAFEPFTHEPAPQADAGAGDDPNRWPGAGLGLAIVKAVAQAHGGTVTAGNDPDGGARVKLTLPTP